MLPKIFLGLGLEKISSSTTLNFFQVSQPYFFCNRGDTILRHGGLHWFKKPVQSRELDQYPTFYRVGNKPMFSKSKCWMQIRWVTFSTSLYWIGLQNLNFFVIFWIKFTHWSNNVAKELKSIHFQNSVCTIFVWHKKSWTFQPIHSWKIWCKYHFFVKQTMS